MRPFPVTVVLCIAASASLATQLFAQGRVTPPPAPRTATVRAVPGPQYDAGRIHRFVLGSGWRDLWLTPLTLPVLDLETFAGGLKPEREGGGKQSVTLHFLDSDARGWIFRSVDKYPAEKSTEAGLEGTLAGRVVQDQVSALHPAGILVIPPLLEALGILHAQPAVHVMPDDPRLGEFRQTFAGMIGALEIKANEGENDAPGFAGSTQIIDTEVMFERAEESARHAVAQRELLRSRLLDFIIGDTDRTRDNHRWARFQHSDDADGYLWRPIPRDRDWAFIRPGGLLAPIASAAMFPKYVPFGFEHSNLSAYTAGSHHIDRRFLNALDRAEFDEEVDRVRFMLSDSVIDAAARRLPATYPPDHVLWLATAMKARRDALGRIADSYYLWLASDVDVRGTNEPDSADIAIGTDGSVTVTLTPRGGPITDGDVEDRSDAPAPGSMPARPYYRRVFRSAETSEVRVYLYGGDDVTVVRGAARTAAPTIRVVGGEGDDVLVDSSRSGNVHLYDAEGANRFVTAERTRVSTRKWIPPSPPVVSRRPGDWVPDWSSNRSWGLLVDYGEGAGVILGAGPAYTDYGFRRLPYRLRVNARALFATHALSPGADLRADYRFEGAPHSLATHIRWSSFDAFRWFGYGNNTDRTGDAESLVRMQRFSFEPSIVWRFGKWRSSQADPSDSTDSTENTGTDVAVGSVPRLARGSVTIGPVFRYTRLEQGETPLRTGVRWQMGAGGRLELQRRDDGPVPRRGVGFSARVAGYPAGVRTRAHATAAAELVGYVPLPIGRPFLAIRAGAARDFGDVPPFDAAAIGGISTVRGFTARRWAGDVAAHGSLELRVPLGRLPWLFPAQTGAFALLDVGRVAVNGESPGGWHKGFGGGAWLVLADQTVSVAYARGERGALYAWLGLPF